MKKIIITLSMLLVFSAVSIGTMDAFSSKDLERQATFSRLATFNVAQGNIGDSDYEPANPNPNAYYISNYIEDPALRNGSYGYEVNQTAADKQEYEISHYTVDAINRYHSSSRPGIYAGTEEYEPTTDEDLRSGYVYYDIAPEFSMANDFTTSYAKLVGDEFEDYTLTSDDLIVVNNNSSTPRFISAGTAAGIEDGTVLIHSDNAEGEYT